MLSVNIAVKASLTQKKKFRSIGEMVWKIWAPGRFLTKLNCKFPAFLQLYNCKKTAFLRKKSGFYKYIFCRREGVLQCLNCKKAGFFNVKKAVFYRYIFVKIRSRYIYYTGTIFLRKNAAFLQSISISISIISISISIYFYLFILFLNENCMGNYGRFIAQ